MTEFTDFFGAPNPRSPRREDLDKKEARVEHCKRVVTEQAADLITPSRELARVLGEKKVKPNVTVVQKISRELPSDSTSDIVLNGGTVGRGRSVINRAKIAKNHAWAKDKAHKDRPYMAHDPDQDLAQGWVISEVKTRYEEHTVILTQEGELKVCGPVQPQVREYGGEDSDREEDKYHTNEVFYEGTVDLQTYPFYETFDTENGHMQAKGDVPSLARKDPVRDVRTASNPDGNPPLAAYTPETFIASNLESIERGLRVNGRALLGLPPS